MSTQAPFALRGRNPDVLTSIANLSNDEVFTPPEFANRMLDTLAEAWAESNDGANIWADSSVTFLDPFTKSGVFLREITKRLVDGLESEIPNLQDRVNHVLTKQVFGIGITELTSLLARRSVYCSKWANGEHSICTAFDNEQGNIWFERTEHTWVGGTEKVITMDENGDSVLKPTNGKCKFCGANQREYDRDAGLETHAYAFIHTLDIKALIAGLFGEEMKFDVIIGNPPYQLDDEGGHRPVPMYHKFVRQAKTLEPRLIVMVTPSRWMAGGLGLSEYRAEMLNDNALREIIDFPIANDVFPGVSIEGGVSYFVRDSGYTGECRFSSVRDSTVVAAEFVNLNEFDVLVRDIEGLSLLRRVQRMGEKSFDQLVASVRPFGDKLRSNFRDFVAEASSSHDVPILLGQKGKRLQVWTKPEYLTANTGLVSSWKIFLPTARGGGHKLPNPVIGRSQIGKPGEICTETFLAIGPFQSQTEATNAANYLNTKFARYLISLRKITQHNVPSTFKWVPVQDWSQKITDDFLYEKYNVSRSEIDHIESRISHLEDGDG